VKSAEYPRLSRVVRVLLAAAYGGILGWFFLQGLQVLTGALPVSLMRENLIRSIENGSLVADNYTWGDTKRGNEQFTDAALFGMLVADDRGWPERGFSARQLVREGSDSYNPSPDLVGFLQGKFAVNPTSPLARVERYWYGARLPAGVFLSAWDLGTSRAVLRFLVWASLLIMVVAGFRAGRGLAVLAVWFGVFGFLIGPARYYGPTFTHGVPLIWANIFAAALFAYARRGARWSFEREVVVIALAGAVASYFDCLSGSLWFSFGFLIALLPWILHAHGSGARSVISQTLTALSVFTGGWVISSVLKQATAGFLFGGDPFGQFFAAARYRVGVGQEIPLSSIWMKLVEASPWIGWGDPVAGRIVWVGGFLLIFVSLALWAWALLVGRKGAAAMFVWTCAATMTPLTWYLLMSNHTMIHAWFSVTWIFLPVGAATASIHAFVRGMIGFAEKPDKRESGLV
jgi:hypothetical protein